eukprot:gnl/MRDRNA2_/MRDRNA2_126710_c0_seq1.p1 gnl/MRDRNA2_/MRDRNA2_126710_c0~~gnl/MRDRNA2_/MRDRNA2_126710_c0_seq1.p1  ORF type:complete len:176 (-),score=15.74 gnl/MRDRNA2_/MRDRNA2_126710_c0_seq1:590-1117(-)
MATTHQHISQASTSSNISPFNSVLQDSSSFASATSSAHSNSRNDSQQVQSDTLTVLGAIGSTFSRCAWERCTGNGRQFTAYYFAFVLVMRCFLKSAAAGALPSVVVMILEDALSITSFVVGVLYLHNTEGIAQMLLRKRTAQSPEMNEVAPIPQPDATQQRTSLSRDLRLFLFAM